MERVHRRIANGGHNIPEDVVLRRYERGLINLTQIPSESLPGTQMTEPTLTELHQKIDAGVRIAIADAIERHRRLGESIRILKDGQIVALTAEQIPQKSSENPNPC